MTALEQARKLERNREYAAARDVLKPLLAEDPTNDKARGKLAVCTYKDPELPVSRRLDDALEILTQCVRRKDPAALTNHDLLGIAGAIYKRKWELTGQEAHLRRSLRLYRLGAAAAEGKPGEPRMKDWYYNAINVAFVLDLLADLDEQVDPSSEEAAQRRTEAKDVRRQVVKHLEGFPEDELKQDWWALVTLVEALIGIDRADDAKKWAQYAGELRASDDDDAPRPWQVESTARQIAAVVRAQEREADATEFKQTSAGERLREIVGKDWAEGVESAYLGKIGLALSGGGFRASLFHIGVLARLAELDVLRRVEVLSCVSGGSILGAYYYLKVEQLIKRCGNQTPGRDEYLKLMQEVEADFLKAIAKNVRMRLLTNPLRVFQMAVSRGYSRTERAGQLYQELIYSPLGDKDWRLPELQIKPGDELEPDTFNPRHENWHRTTKVPILIVNATAMNTGHNWQFAATWMGEPPSAIDDDVDSADRLRRMYYTEAPDGYKDPSLGRAVAASAAVPGLFPPIKLRKLYPGITVELSDGGVHDNQGIASLIDQDCSVILVSDASGQGESIVEPKDRAPLILSRTMSVTMARIRQAQWLDLVTRRAASSLRGLMFVHLKKDLPRANIKWCPDSEEPVHDTGLTDYGVSRDVQRKLASIRTDLDSFHQYEAYGLMASGYRMVEHYFPRDTVGFPPAESRHAWSFCAIQDAMKGGEHRGDMLDKLERSDRLFFKWFPYPGLMTKFVIGLLFALIGAGIWAAAEIDGAVGVIVLLGAMVAAIVLCAAPDESWFIYGLSLSVKIPLGLLAMFVAPLIAWPYLRTLNPLYLKNGEAPSTPCVWADDP